MTDKRLNLTKYAFLDYLKGDIFAWLNCNDNYQKASEEDEQLRILTPWRYSNDEEDNEFDIDEYYKDIRYGVERDDLDLTTELPDQIKAGLRVGRYSELWAKGEWPSHEPITINGQSNEENINKTKELLSLDKDLIIFEATFKYNDFVIRTDILVKTGDEVKIIEVKGSSTPKLLYAFDLWFQKQIIELSNQEYNDWDYSLLLLNREYTHDVRYTEEQEAKFVFVNTNMVTNAHSLGAKKIPEIDPSKSVSWTKSLNNYWKNELIDWIGLDQTPSFMENKKGKNFTFPIEQFFETYLAQEMEINFDDILQRIREIQLMDQPPKLEFEDRNNKYMKSDYMIWALQKSGAYEVENSIFDFRGNKLNWKVKCQLFLNGVKSMDEPSIEDIVPATLLSKVKGMSDEQAIMQFLDSDGKGAAGYSPIIQRNYFSKNEKLLHKILLKESLADYDRGPIYMYDFETANLAIPEVDKSSPYEQIVYQYSIHVITNPNDYDFATMKNVHHYEWLAEDRDTFHIEAWKNFVNVFKKHGEGVYVAWNDSFEKNCIKRALDNWDFDEETAGWMKEIQMETIDLMVPFRNKYYYHKDLKGSYSIKYAGPHFAPEINYKDLNLVQRGDQSAAVAKMWLREKSKQSDIDWGKRRKDMLKYCEFDTLLMVAILQRLQAVSCSYFVFPTVECVVRVDSLPVQPHSAREKVWNR